MLYGVCSANTFAHFLFLKYGLCMLSGLDLNSPSSRLSLLRSWNDRGVPLSPDAALPQICVSIYCIESPMLSTMVIRKGSQTISDTINGELIHQNIFL